MGKSSGSKSLAAATDEAFATDAKPLTGVLPCKKGKTLLKLVLRRIDTDQIVANLTAAMKDMPSEIERIRIEKDLHFGVRKHHRPDVPALHHHRSALRHAPLF